MGSHPEFSVGFIRIDKGSRVQSEEPSNKRILPSDSPIVSLNRALQSEYIALFLGGKSVRLHENWREREREDGK